MAPRPYIVFESQDEGLWYRFTWRIVGETRMRETRLLEGPFGWKRLWRKLDREVRAV